MEQVPAKAKAPISCTESGITTLVNSLQSLKAATDIIVVPSGMMPTPSFTSKSAIS